MVCRPFLIGKKQAAIAYYSDRTVLTVVCVLFLYHNGEAIISGLACEKLVQSITLQLTCKKSAIKRAIYGFFCLSMPQFWFILLDFPSGRSYCTGIASTLRIVEFNFVMVSCTMDIGRNCFGGNLQLLSKVTLVLITGIFGVRLGPDMQVMVHSSLSCSLRRHIWFSNRLHQRINALPEVPDYILERRRRINLARKKKMREEKKKLKQKRANLKSHSGLDSRDETTVKMEPENKVQPPPPPLHMEPPLWRKCYYAFVSRTNMHMLEFVSLAISALTLWSGLMFFLNDQQQRMSRVWTQVFL